MICMPAKMKGKGVSFRDKIKEGGLVLRQKKCGGGMKITIVCEKNVATESEEGRRAYPAGDGRVSLRLSDGGGARRRMHPRGRGRRTRADGGDPRRHGRAVLVGARLSRRGLRRARGKGRAEGVARHGADRAAFGARFKDHQKTSGHVMLAGVGRRRSTSGSGASIPRIPSRGGWEILSTFRTRRCTGSLSTSPCPTSWCISAGSRAEEVFRAGCVFRRGRGKIFYFNPGH